MTDAPKYRVMLSGQVEPERERDAVLDALAALFHSRRERMEQLLQGKPVALKKEYERAEAERIRDAIRAAGAQCAVEAVVVADEAPDEIESESVMDDSHDSIARDEVDDAPQTDSEVAHEESTRDETPHDDSALMRFVAVNTDYYRRQFAKFGDLERAKFAISWHWPAFVAFFFWAMYRKLWMWAAINLLGGIVLALAVQPGLLYLAWALFWPLSANYLYFRHARRCVLARDDAMDDDAPTAVALRAGGVSRAAVCIGVMLIALVSAGLNNIMQDQLIDRYSARLGEAMPGPGSQQRGDGSVIDGLDSLDPQAAKTAAALATIAAALNLALRDADADPDAAAETLLNFARRRVRDSWGNAIRVSQQADRIELVSAGPDGRFGNADDILQYVPFNRLQRL